MANIAQQQNEWPSETIKFLSRLSDSDSESYSFSLSGSVCGVFVKGA